MQNFKTVGSLSKVDFTKNSNLFTKLILHHWLKRYVGKKMHLNYHVACMMDRNRKPPLPIPFNYSYTGK